MNQEEPLFTIKCYNSVELQFDFTTLLPAYKRRRNVYRFLGTWFVVIAVANIINYGSDVDWIKQVFCIFFVIYDFWDYPAFVRRNVKKNFRSNPANGCEHVVPVYIDRIEVDNTSSRSSTRYEGISRMEETNVGVYLFLSVTTAYTIPRDAVPANMMDFLRQKVGR